MEVGRSCTCRGVERWDDNTITVADYMWYTQSGLILWWNWDMKSQSKWVDTDKQCWEQPDMWWDDGEAEQLWLRALQQEKITGVRIYNDETKRKKKFRRSRKKQSDHLQIPNSNSFPNLIVFSYCHPTHRCYKPILNTLGAYLAYEAVLNWHNYRYQQEVDEWPFFW